MTKWTLGCRSGEIFYWLQKREKLDPYKAAKINTEEVIVCRNRESTLYLKIEEVAKNWRAQRRPRRPHSGAWTSSKTTTTTKMLLRRVTQRALHIWHINATRTRYLAVELRSYVMGCMVSLVTYVSFLLNLQLFFLISRISVPILFTLRIWEQRIKCFRVGP